MHLNSQSQGRMQFIFRKSHRQRVVPSNSMLPPVTPFSTNGPSPSVRSPNFHPQQTQQSFETASNQKISKNLKNIKNSKSIKNSKFSKNLKNLKNLQNFQNVRISDLPKKIPKMIEITSDLEDVQLQSPKTSKNLKNLEHTLDEK